MLPTPLDSSLFQKEADTEHVVHRFFNRLGEHIAERIGSDATSAMASLESVAVDALNLFDPSSHISLDQIVDYVLSAKTLCSQNDLEGKFAEPPVSLFHGATFDISALIWLDGTTSIHQHSFSGAFHVLAGSSIHSRYRFEPTDAAAYGQRALSGSLKLEHIEVLKQGETRPIRRGASMIHALFHMVRPSVTIVVRTICDPMADGPQYDYRWPGLAVDPFQRDAPTIRRLQYLRTLRRLDEERFQEDRKRVLARADLFLAYAIISEQVVATGHVQDGALLIEQCLNLDDADRGRVLAAAHNDLLSRGLIELRKKLHASQHRFLLALLLNVFDRRRLIELVASEWRTDQPVALIRTWMAEMCGLTEQYPNLLGLDMNDTALNVLDRLWQGDSEEAMLGWFELQFGSEAIAPHASNLRLLYVALRDCPLFYQVMSDLR